MTKKLGIASISLISFIIAITSAVLFFGHQLLKSPVSSDKTEVVFDVSPGSTLVQISNNLQDAGLIRHSKSFQLYAKAKGLASKFKVGEYSLNQAMTPDDIMGVIVSGKSIAHNLTIAEGLNIFDIAQIFEKNNVGPKEEFLKLIHDKIFIKSLFSDPASTNENLTSLEGYLFPETYKITKFEGTKSVVTQMVNRFLVVWKEIEPQVTPLIQQGWTRNQIVTLASIVEKETGASFERPIVSSVFHNRITQKMRLQTDPTVLYGLALQQGRMPTNITKNDLLTPSSHNTYTIGGLPPTPIANPGKEALLATVKPARTNYLYFVSQNNGTHAFSETFEQHNNAVKDFQLNPKARENKSWKDLKQADR